LKTHLGLLCEFSVVSRVKIGEGLRILQSAMCWPEKVDEMIGKLRHADTFIVDKAIVE
jgi:hypothetical protein